MIRLLNRLLAAVLMGLIRIYQQLVSPLLPPSCRFYPTCSAYGLEAISTYGPLRGGWLTLWRILRCHPWGGSGHDPVPPKTSSSTNVSPKAQQQPPSQNP